MFDQFSPHLCQHPHPSPAPLRWMMDSSIGGPIRVYFASSASRGELIAFAVSFNSASTRRIRSSCAAFSSSVSSPQVLPRGGGGSACSLGRSSYERRVGEECVSTRRARCAPETQ